MMKRSILLLLFLITTITTFSQEHIKFMGIPIDGSIISFVEKLKTKGLVVKNKENGVYVLSGKFASYDNAEIFVFSTPKTNIVFKVVVYLPEKKTWSSIKSQYSDMVDLYSQKYALTAHFEYFMSPYYEGDSYEEQAVKLEKAIWSSFFKCDGGAIAVEISKYMQLKIAYEDEINQNNASSEIESQVLDDI